MNFWFDRVLTKRNALLIGFVGAVSFCTLFLFYFLFSKTNACPGSISTWSYGCKFAVHSSVILQPLSSLAILIPPLAVTLFLREEIFKTWFRFAVWATPLVILFPYLTSNENGHFSPSTREGLEVVLSILFLFLSTLIIVMRSIQLSWKK